MALEQQITINVRIITTRIQDMRRRDLDRLRNTNACDHDQPNHKKNASKNEELIIGLIGIFHENFATKSAYDSGLYGTIQP